MKGNLKDEIFTVKERTYLLSLLTREYQRLKRDSIQPDCKNINPVIYEEMVFVDLLSKKITHL